MDMTRSSWATWELGERKEEGREGTQVQHRQGKGYTKGWDPKMSGLYESGVGDAIQPLGWSV